MHQPKEVDINILNQKFNTFSDSRGKLTVAEIDELNLPFIPKRVFWIHEIPTGTQRGEHANRSCQELIIAINGSFKLWLSDGKNEKEYILDTPNEGVYIPPMVWCKLTEFTPGTICLCLADKEYNESEYINDYKTFLKETSNENNSIPTQ
jgi:dTDP-4-dehydrorhamnose 3,5-epimerase-like enzyme